MTVTVVGPPAGMVGDGYDAGLTATGGAPPYTWTSSPPLPAGLTLETLPGQQARIHGTPTEPFTYKITVTDAANDTGEADLIINPKLAISTPNILRGAKEGKRYSQALDATGGGKRYTWNASETPDGLDVSPNGTITWKSPAGSARFHVYVADNATPRHTDDGEFTIPLQARWWGRLFHISNWLAFLALGVPILGGVWIIIYSFATAGSHWTYVGVGMATALAAFLTGCLIGFLFGIPRIVSSGQSRFDPQSTEYAPSSNLAEVSDWLTKLLLGAGLVQLTHLGAPIGHLINTVAAGLTATTATTATTAPSSAAKVIAGGILFGYVTIGLLDSYIVTTLWYQNRLGKIGTG